ncbi:MAG: sigma 54-dependent Fis family transcriptional regulator [Bradymonadaceae bacterium]|nr:sigma 54-dependent Fis family transcriptional regulator [Lujinxingiaceae bacterium]
MSDVTRTVYLDGGEQKLELQRYRLAVLEGPNAGDTSSWEGRRVTLGSSPENDVVLDDGATSRFHAVVEVSEQGYVLRDIDSKNGTFVDGLRVREVYLSSPTTFRIGATSIRFDTTGEEVEVRISGREQFGGLLGRSVAMREIFSLLERVAPTDATVLIEGESGTGKELVADAVHNHSPRRGGPLIVLDCSAIPRDLIESELFGHVKGAFTGATGARKGAFEAAKGGTLFLDELGELAIDLQPKLLRALEKREIKPVGSNETVKTDVRIVAATNRNLLHEVKQGNFREDLYYRFAVIRVHLPPLRDRSEDVTLLVEHFLEAANKMAGRTSGVEVSYKTMDKLKRHRWPGNVRELKNFVERAVLLTQSDTIETKFLNVSDPGPISNQAAETTALPMVDLAIEQNLPFKDAKNRLVEQFEIEYWSRLLERTDGNVSKAARIAGVHRKSVEYILKKLDLSREDIGINPY